MQKWVEIDDWKQLPVGEWLVKTDNKHRPYGVARCVLNGKGHKIITIGAMFSWDAGQIEAYSDFEKYKPV